MEACHRLLTTKKEKLMDKCYQLGQNVTDWDRAKEDNLTDKNDNKDTKKDAKEVTEDVHEDDRGERHLKKSMIIWKFWFLINLTDLQTVKCFHFKVSQFFSNLIFLDPFGHQYWNTAIFWMNIRSNILRLAVCWMDIHREIRFTLPLLALAAAEDLPRLSEDFHKDCKYISGNYSGTWLWEIYESSCRGGQEEEGPRWSGWDAKSEKLCTFSKKIQQTFFIDFQELCPFLTGLVLEGFYQKMKVGSFLVCEASTSLVPLCSVTVTSMNLGTLRAKERTVTGTM